MRKLPSACGRRQARRDDGEHAGILPRFGLSRILAARNRSI